jgi:hypothetical protein
LHGVLVGVREDDPDKAFGVAGHEQRL